MTGWFALRWLWAAIRARLGRRGRAAQSSVSSLRPGPDDVVVKISDGSLTPMSFGFRAEPGEDHGVVWPAEDAGGFGVPARPPLTRLPQTRDYRLISWGPVLDPPWPLPAGVTGGQRVMCQIPEDCPLGPGPHPFTLPADETALCCARQPWEDTPQ